MKKYNKNYNKQTDTKISGCNPHTSMPDITRLRPQENKNKKIIAKPRDHAWLLRGYWEPCARKFHGDVF